MTFNKFMWLKTLGRWEGMKIDNYGFPASTYLKYERNKKIVEEAGVKEYDWEEAKNVLR